MLAPTCTLPPGSLYGLVQRAVERIVHLPGQQFQPQSSLFGRVTEYLKKVR